MRTVRLVLVALAAAACSGAPPTNATPVPTASRGPTAVPTAAPTPTIQSTAFAPEDLAETLPTAVNGKTLVVRAVAVDQLLAGPMGQIVTDLGVDERDVAAATATWTGSVELLEIGAYRLRGVSADLLLSRLREGEYPPRATTAHVVSGHFAIHVLDNDNTTFHYFYPKGEVLYTITAIDPRDGQAAEVDADAALAALP